MRLQHILGLVLLTSSLPAAAQDTLAQRQKAASLSPAASDAPDAQGIPVNPDAAKTGTLIAGKIADAITSFADADKIAGNPEVTPPLADRTKLVGFLPDPAPTPADLGTGPDGAKTAELISGKRADAIASISDNDKIAGNPEVFPPLQERRKAAGVVPEGATAADFGQPAAGDAPKLADVAVGKAQVGQPTIYDEDKIVGNEPPPEPLSDRQKARSFNPGEVVDADKGVPATGGDAPKLADLGVSHADAVPTSYDDDKIAENNPLPEPLVERQKLPGALAEGTSPSAFGQPVIDAPKVADLGVNKGEAAVPTVEDNDKITGNPYVEPPLTPRQKLASVLPDPVVDANMGQPVVEAPKTDIAISKAALSVTNIEDNDKIAGNPLVYPPLTDRTKAPATVMPAAGISAADLGMPADEAAPKTDMAASKAAESAPSVYDDDKIAENNVTDPFMGGEDFGADPFVDAPPADLVAAVRVMLDDPVTRTATLDAIKAQGRAPATIAEPFQGFVTALYDQPVVLDRLATDIAQVFNSYGVAPENTGAVGRMAAEQLATFGDPEARKGIARLPLAERRAYLTDALRIAATLTPEQCGPFLDGTMEVTALRQTELTAMGDWTPAEVQTTLIRQAAAIVAELQDAPVVTEMPATDYDRATQLVGERALAAIDASENGPALLLAYGDPTTASAADLCAVHRTILQAVLDSEGADGDLLVRYIIDYGWVR
jgi:hypothetical protein